MSKATHLLAIDLGEVLLSVDHAATYQRLSPTCALPAAEIARRLDDTALIHALDRGEISPAQFTDAVGAELGINLTVAALQSAWQAILKPKPDVVAWLESMLPRVTCVLASNTNWWHWEEAQTLLPLLQQFDGHLLSFREGVRKPEAAYFERLRQRWPQPHALFIDDRAENCRAAAAQGFSVCEFRELSTLTVQVDAWLRG